MTFKLTKDTIFYVACPPNYATGGTELLHQLVHKLIKMGYKAKMFYIDAKSGDPVHDNFKIYNIEWVNEIVDSKNNVFIVPETFTYILNHYCWLQKSIWWLSVDNYYQSLPKKRKMIPTKEVKLFFMRMLGFPKKSLPKVFFRFEKSDKRIVHLYQCEYVKQHLIAKGITSKMAYLSDYLNKVFLTERVDYTSTHRKDYVLYNPLKGFEFTTQLIALAPGIEWKPLQNMTPGQLKALLKESKVYIDFGHHPGKDRFPREAAISGCCVITGKRGSAHYREDVPIADSYKFDETSVDLKDVIHKVRECLANYDYIINDFSAYREMILGEEARFDSDIKEIFHCN